MSEEREWGWHQSDPLTIRNDAGEPVARVLTTAEDARMMAAAPVMRELLEKEHATVGCGIYFDADATDFSMCKVCAVLARIRGEL